ncbi:MAG: hypothetical protein J5J00_10635 [Deltaproteobacteria bacterium]|nr:hypothetical protein [Deltaproteobacteria bacterium]
MKAITQHIKSRAVSERGVFIPLLAVTLLGVAYVLIALGFDASMIKQAQIDLRAKVDMICKDLGATPLSYQENAATFRNYISRIQSNKYIKFTDILEARLVTPTMPQMGHYPFPGAAITPEVTQITFSALGFPRCTLKDPLNDCKFVGEVDSSNYPPNVLDPVRNAGNTVGCEVVGKVRTLLLGKVRNPKANEITVRSVYWAPVRAPKLYRDYVAPYDPVFYKPSLDVDDKIATLPGLTIGVGTQMFTSVWDGRFRFGAPTSAPNPLAPLAAYNAMQKFMAKQDGVLSGAQPPVSWNGWTLSGVNPPRHDVYFGAITRVGGVFDYAASILPGNHLTMVDAAAGNIPSDRESMLVSCMNPAVLVRNLFLSTIVELAARHGQLRNMTEILHINPMHRHSDFFPGGVGAAIPNSPAIITKYGEDIAQRLYNVPYIFYHTGIDDINFETPPVEDWSRNLGFTTYSKNGWLNPFSAVPAGFVAGDANWRQHHALIAGQLRYCYHMYGSSDYFDRYRAFYGTVFGGHAFEPSDLEMTADRPKPVAYATGDRWDQSTIDWDVNTLAPISSSPSDNAKYRALTAGEVVSILGTTQMCPYSESYPDPNLLFGPLNEEVKARFPGIERSICPLTTINEVNATSKRLLPINATSGVRMELRPDLLGFMRYVANPSFQGVVNPPTVRAIDRPGIAPVRAAAAPGAAEPFAAGEYHTTQNIMSHILIVTHQPITEEEKDDIKAEVEAMRLRNPVMMRPITVVYIPTTLNDSGAADLYRAFGAVTVDDLSGSHNEAESVLYNISPYDPTFGKVCATDLSKEEWEVFRDYWECLLTDSGENIVAQARNIFYERILQKEIRF